MRHTRSFRWSVFAAAVVGAGLLAWPAAGAAQTVVGDAKAVQATTFGLIGGTTTVLADTGWLSGPSDVLDASLITGDVPSLLSGEVLDAVTIGWPDQVVSQANLASLGLTVAGIPISADFVMATGTPLIARLSMTELPLLPPPRTDCALASTESAEMPVPAITKNVQRAERKEPPSSSAGQVASVWVKSASSRSV